MTCDTSAFKVTPVGSLGSFVPGVSVHKAVEIMLTCPQCEKQWKGTAYRSVWVHSQENLDLILNDRINFVTCPSCGFSDRLQFAFMAADLMKRVAIWYEPFPDPRVDFCFAYYQKHYGADSFYARAPRVQDWTDFKRRLLQLNSQPYVPIPMEDLARLAGVELSATEFGQGMQSATDKVHFKPERPGCVGDKIASLVDGLRAKGHKIPRQVSEIPGFPCPTFDALRTKLSSGKLILYKPVNNYSSEVFTLVATRGESTVFKISVAVMYMLPIIAICLGILVRWPWALLCPFLMYTGWKIGRSTYMKAIFRSAAESEMNFCFLFCSYKVGVALPDCSKVYIWEGSYPTSPPASGGNI